MTTDPTPGDAPTPPDDATATPRPAAQEPGARPSSPDTPPATSAPGTPSSAASTPDTPSATSASSTPSSATPTPGAPSDTPTSGTPTSGLPRERETPPEYTQSALPRYTQQNPPHYAPPPRPDSAPQPDGARRPAGSGFFDSIRRTGLYRAHKRWVGGVAAGFAARLGWDPLLVRGLLVLSLFIGGIGLVAYAVGWALMPDESDGRIHLEEAIRGTFDVAVLGAAVLLLVGFAWGGPWQWGFYGDSEWIAAVFWLAVVGGVIYLLVKAATRRPSLEGEPHALPYPAPPYAPQGGPGAQGAPGTQAQAPHAAQPYPTTTPAATQPRAGGADALVGGGPAPAYGPGPAYNGPHYPVPRAGAPGVVVPGMMPGVAPGQAGPAAGRPPYPGAPYPGTPYAGHPQPPRPPRPPKGGGSGIVLGLILLLGAGLLFIRYVLGGDVWFLPSGDGQLFGTWIGGSLAVIGVAIVVAGLRGRSSGGLGALAIIGLIFAVPAAAVYVSEPYLDSSVERGGEILDDVFDARVDGYEPGVPLTEGTASPDTIAQAERGYAVQWGEPTIDLTDLDLTEIEPGEPAEIPIAVGAGTARIVIPDDAAVDVDGRISAGVLEWNVDGEQQSFSSFDGEPFEVSSDEVGDDGAQLRLVVDVSAGEAVIEEER